jgi:hypothetical protein
MHWLADPDARAMASSPTAKLAAVDCDAVAQIAAAERGRVMGATNCEATLSGAGPVPVNACSASLLVVAITGSINAPWQTEATVFAANSSDAALRHGTRPPSAPTRPLDVAATLSLNGSTVRPDPQPSESDKSPANRMRRFLVMVVVLSVECCSVNGQLLAMDQSGSSDVSKSDVRSIAGR